MAFCSMQRLEEMVFSSFDSHDTSLKKEGEFNCIRFLAFFRVSEGWKLMNLENTMGDGESKANHSRTTRTVYKAIVFEKLLVKNAKTDLVSTGTSKRI